MTGQAKGTGSDIRIWRAARHKRGKSKETYLALEIAKLGPDFHDPNQMVVVCTLYSAHSSKCCKLAAAAKASTFVNKAVVEPPMSEDDEDGAEDDAASHSSSDPGFRDEDTGLSESELVSNHRSVSEVTL